MVYFMEYPNRKWRRTGGTPIYGNSIDVGEGDPILVMFGCFCVENSIVFGNGSSHEPGCPGSHPRSKNDKKYTQNS